MDGSIDTPIDLSLGELQQLANGLTEYAATRHFKEPLPYHVRESYRQYREPQADAPTVSVIVPVYNTRGFLCECLDSVLGQTFADFEVICVDDGSTDGSADILDEYAARDERVTVRHQKNGGPSRARNLGLSLAKGEYICFVDSDDGLAPGALERFVAVAEEERADIVVCGLDIDHFPNPGEAPAWIRERNPKRYKVYPTFEPALLFDEPGAKPFAQRDFVRRALLRENDIWFSDDFWLGEDTILQFEMFPKARNVVFVPDELCYYRSGRSESLMAQGYAGIAHKALQHACIVSHLASVWKCEGYLQRWGAPFAEWAVSFFYNQFKLCPESSKGRIACLFMAAATQFMSEHLYGLMAERWQARYGKIEEYASFGLGPVPLVTDGPYPDLPAHDAVRPRVSIVVSGVHSDKRMARTLVSLLGQTFEDIEVVCTVSQVVLNNERFWSRYTCDARLRFEVLPDGTTKDHSRVLGAQAANGDWILFCDAGDTLDEGLCEWLVSGSTAYAADIVQFVTYARSEGVSRSECLSVESEALPYFGILEGSDVCAGWLRGRLYGPSLTGKAFSASVVKRACTCACADALNSPDGLYALLAQEALSYRGVAGGQGYTRYLELQASLAKKPPVEAWFVGDASRRQAMAACMQGSPMSVSIIVPVHNAAAWLEECLDSIESQTSGTFEVICVDDGSSDGSAAILETACNKWDNLLVLRLPHTGVSEARNVGLNHARGAYVLFVDADDILDSRLLETVLATAYGTDADMTIFGFDEYWKSVEHVVARGMCREGALQNRGFALEEMEGVSTSLVTPNVWRILWKRSFIEGRGLRFHGDLRTSEDLAFIYEALFSKPVIAFVAEVLYHYRRDGGATLTRCDRGLDGYRALRYIRERAALFGSFSNERMVRHYVNLVLDVAEYALGSAATQAEFLELYRAFQANWRPLVMRNEHLIVPRYRAFWEATSAADAETYLFSLYGGARETLERMRAKNAPRFEAPQKLGEPAGNVDDAGKRYARVLFVGDFSLGEASVGHRAVACLRDAGHAVLPVDRSAASPEYLLTVVSSFRPTVAMGDGPLGEIGDVLVHENLAVLSVGPTGTDEAYRELTISRTGVRRLGWACTQVWTPERERQIAGAESQGVRPPQLFDASWPQALCNGTPGANSAYHLRTVDLVVYFAGDDAPTTAEVALRIAEGSAVLCEEGSQYKVAPTLRDGLVVFPKGGLAQALRTYENAGLLEETRRYQGELLDGLEPLERALERVLREADEACQGTGNACVLSYGSPAVTVGLYGWFGARNFGDDLLMSLAIDRLEQRYSNLYPWIIGARPRTVWQEWGYEAYEPGQKSAIAGMLRRSRALVYCGGLIFDEPMAATAGDCEFALDPWIEPSGQAAIALLARGLGASPVLFGGGAGPVDWRATQTAVRLMGMANMLFLCRDQRACDLIEAAGIRTENIKLRADLAYGSRGYIERHADAAIPNNLVADSYFMVSLRQWSANPADFAGTMAAAIERIVDETGLAAAFVPFDAEDASLHREVARHLRPELPHVVFDERPSEGAFFALLRGSAFAVAMRLHCCILHHVLGKPAVGLNYNDKVEAHFDKVGELPRLLALDANSADIARTAIEAWNECATIGETLGPAIEAGARMVDVASEELYGLIDRWTPVSQGREMCFPRTVGRASQSLTKARNDANKKARECDALSGELEAARSMLERVQDRCAQLTRDHASEIAGLRATIESLQAGAGSAPDGDALHRWKRMRG